VLPPAGSRRRRAWRVPKHAAHLDGRASRASTLPARLTDAEFWSLVETMSEPDGSFQSNNLVSNEDTFQFVIPDLRRVVKPGGVYVGVGPDQNFTFIANLKPGIVFIPDIRRGNLHMHLMYKVLMEASADRADFPGKVVLAQAPRGPDGGDAAGQAVWRVCRRAGIQGLVR
jgi:hypothetical protein